VESLEKATPDTGLKIPEEVVYLKRVKPSQLQSLPEDFSENTLENQKVRA